MKTSSRPSVSFTITEDKYYLARFYCELRSGEHPALDGDGNILGFIYKSSKESPNLIHMDWRFRWYEDNKVFKSKDRRKTYRHTIELKEEFGKTDEEQIVKTLTAPLKLMIPKLRIDTINGGAREIGRVLENVPRNDY